MKEDYQLSETHDCDYPSCGKQAVNEISWYDDDGGLEDFDYRCEAHTFLEENIEYSWMADVRPLEYVPTGYAAIAAGELYVAADGRVYE